MHLRQVVVLVALISDRIERPFGLGRREEARGFERPSERHRSDQRAAFPTSVRSACLRETGLSFSMGTCYSQSVHRKPAGVSAVSLERPDESNQPILQEPPPNPAGGAIMVTHEPLAEIGR